MKKILYVLLSIIVMHYMCILLVYFVLYYYSVVIILYILSFVYTPYSINLSLFPKYSESLYVIKDGGAPQLYCTLVMCCMR